MSVGSAVLQGRRAAEARMTSTCTIRRKTGETAQNETTGLEEPVMTAIHTGIPFRLGGTPRGDAPTRRVDLGGVEIQLAVRTAHLPADTSDLTDGDVIEVIGGENAGKFLRIVEASWQDQATARRVPVVELP